MFKIIDTIDDFFYRLTLSTNPFKVAIGMTWMFLAMVFIIFGCVAGFVLTMGLLLTMPVYGFAVISIIVAIGAIRIANGNRVK